jgi:hypothetical protein
MGINLSTNGSQLNNSVRNKSININNELSSATNTSVPFNTINTNDKQIGGNHEVDHRMPDSGELERRFTKGLFY